MARVRQAVEVRDISLVVTDLDRTLWPDSKNVPAATVAAWHELERRGIPVVVATGRRLTSTRVPLAALGLRPPAVVLNGALGIDLATGARFHQHLCDPAQAVQILAAFRAHDLEPCVYVHHDDFDVFVGDRPSTHPQHLEELGTGAQRYDLEEVVATFPVLMFGLLGVGHERVAPVADALDGFAQAHSQDGEIGGHAFTVSPLGLSKWLGVEAYCAHAGVDVSRVLAIGDGPNDIELLTGAAVAVTPEDAHPTALAVADHVVPSARDAGWAALLDLV